MADVKDIINGVETLFLNADGKNTFLVDKYLPLYDASIKAIEAGVADSTQKGQLLYKCWWMKKECLLRNRPDDNQVSECNSKLRELGKFKPA